MIKAGKVKNVVVVVVFLMMTQMIHFEEKQQYSIISCK